MKYFDTERYSRRGLVGVEGLEEELRGPDRREGVITGGRSSGCWTSAVDFDS